MPVVLLNDTRVDQHHGCTRVVAAIESLAASSGMQLLATSPAHSDWQQNESFMGALRKARLVIVNGEGTIHHDRASGLALLAVAEYSRALGIPAALVNCGWESNSSRALELLRDFTTVSVRDSQSAVDIQAAGINCGVVPDLSLFLPAGPLTRGRVGVGFTDSVVRSSSAKLETIRRRVRGVAVPIQYSLAGAMGSYRFLREYVGVSDLGSPMLLARMLVSRVSQFRAQVASPDHYLSRLAGLQLLVSGRFHACTLALLAQTPFISVSSNSRKIECLVHDAGLDASRVVNNPDDIRLDRIDQYAWSQSEVKSIAHYVDMAREDARKLFLELRALG